MITNQQLLAAVKAQPIGFGCGALAVVLGLAIYFRGGLLPEAESLLDQNATLGERIDANLKNGVQLTEQLAAITSARKQIEARLVRPDELAKNQQFFYKLEAETGIKLIDLRQNQVPAAKPGAKGPKTNYIPVGYAVAVRGSYAHLLDFLRRLESDQRFCRVMTASINLGGTSDKDRANELTLNLGLELLGQP
ncbi:MAG: hypothetical protein NT173_02075 [Opitutales bacterium]|nr:hypothetical protein [Opitutales bacterium]